MDTYGSTKESCVVRKPTRVEKSRRTKVAPLTLEEKFMQNWRHPITLQVFMPRNFWDYIFLSLICYQVSNEEESSDNEKEMEQAIAYRTYWSLIIFTDDDRLLGSKIHNHPFFVTGYIWEQQVNCILIDGGSGVNILPLKILKELGISLDELLPSRLMIQGLNQDGQRVVGKIRLQMLIGEMELSALFHVIDAETT